MNITSKNILKIKSPEYSLFGFLFAFMNRIQSAADSFYDEITYKQFFLLACLSLFKKESPTANDLAEIMGCSRQNVKQILDSLVKKGFLVLEQDENDLRKQKIIPTQKVQEISKKYRQREKKFMKSLYDGISENEILSVYETLCKMEKNLKKMSESKK